MSNFEWIVAVIPALNESSTIKTVVRGVKKYVDETVVVDDGSSDNTGESAQRAGAAVITHKVNKGYDASIEDGFKEALRRGATIIITLDADGQHDPSDIGRLVAVMQDKGFHVVISDRGVHRRHWGERIYGWYTTLRYGIRDPLSGLKAYRKEVYESIGYFDRVRSVGTQLAIEALEHGFSLGSIPISVKDRHKGDNSRFYARRIRANLKIISAVIRIIRR